MKIFYSKSRIDKAGTVLSRGEESIDEEYLELDEVFEDYRRSHLSPLTELTARMQGMLGCGNDQYYIAQRLKRKPQILRKLTRFKSRLTQLQDIGGLRIIVEDNDVVDRISNNINKNIESSQEFNLYRNTDYRPDGRDDSGYRALHKIISYETIKLEIQVRTRAQHYWAESIERTSVFYGRRLKEGQGSNLVLLYFKTYQTPFLPLSTVKICIKKHWKLCRRSGIKARKL